MVARSVVVIGNFDGVHRGHVAVLTQALGIANEHGLRCLVLTFSPHPAEVLGRGAPQALSTLATRIALLRAHGASDVIVEPFTISFSSWSPERFATELLAGRLNAKAVVVGRNFRFGQGRAGDFDTLRALGATLDFAAVAADVAGDDRGAFSSSRVREAVSVGDVGHAHAILGRPHTLRGTVVHGDARGRLLGFPTANLTGIGEMLPAYGVYAVRVLADLDASGPSVAAPGVMNVGMRPTVGGRELRVEAHLFDFEGDLYGRVLRVELIHRIRAEMRFADVDALKTQIADDVREARAVLSL
jgi:riboflavin kinase/FMN adenylyltransferase